MSYKKQEWIDHIEDIDTHEVLQQGTLYCARLMNHMEDGIYRAHEEIENLNSECTDLKKNSAIGVAEIINVAKSYYDVRYKTDNTPLFLYDTSHTPLGGNYNPSDSTYAGAIDCSTYIGLVLRGIPVEKSPFSHLLDSTINDEDNNLEGNDTGIDIGNDEVNPEPTLDPKLIRENKNDYSWAINPFEWKVSVEAGGTPTPIRTSSQIAQWMFERGMSIPLDETFSNLEPGDIIFWAKKDSNGNYKQPNRYKHISHLAICVGKYDHDADDTTFPEKYPYKHTMLEATTIPPYILNRTLEKISPDEVVMICRPDLGGLTTEQYAGNITTSLGITNISELYRPGIYYLTSNVTEGLPNGIEDGIYLALRVERTLTRQGKVNSLIQTLVNTYTNETVYRRTQYCYSHKPNSTSWTPWKSASDIVTLPTKTTENDIYALSSGLYVISKTITFTADSSIIYKNGLTSVPSLYKDDLIWIKEQPSNKYIHCLTNGVRYTISSSNTISGVCTTDGSYVQKNTPTNDDDLVTKKYVDDLVNSIISTLNPS